VEYTLNWHAIPGETPRATQTGPVVVPGTYTVSLTVDGATYTRRFAVRQDPRVAVPQAGLVAQLQLEQRMMAGLAVSFDAWHNIQTERATLTAAARAAQRGSQGAPIAAAAAPVDTQLASLAATGLGAANRDLARQLADMAIGDVEPTASVIAATTATCTRLDSALAAIDRVQRTGVDEINRKLVAAGASAVPYDQRPPRGCHAANP